MRRRTLITVLIVGLVLVNGCDPYKCLGGDIAALSEWSKHREVLNNDRWGEMDLEFRDAYEFFKRLTGVEVRTDFDYVGIVKSEDTIEDLEKIDFWYGRNCRCLFLNNKMGRVEIRPDHECASDGKVDG